MPWTKAKTHLAIFKRKIVNALHKTGGNYLTTLNVNNCCFGNTEEAGLFADIILKNYSRFDLAERIHTSKIST